MELENMNKPLTEVKIDGRRGRRGRKANNLRETLIPKSHTDLEETPNSIKHVSDNDDYIIDPRDSSKKYLVPKGKSDYIIDNRSLLPTLRREGFEIMWEIDDGGPEMQRRFNEGWRFVDENYPGCEGARVTVKTTTRLGIGLYRALWIPKDKYEFILRKKNEFSNNQYYSMMEENENDFAKSVNKDKVFRPIKKNIA